MDIRQIGIWILDRQVYGYQIDRHMYGYQIDRYKYKDIDSTYLNCIQVKER